MRPALPTHQSVASTSSSSAPSPSATTPDSPSAAWTDWKGRRRSGDSSSLLSGHRTSHHRHGPLRQLRNALSSVPDASGLGSSALAALARDVYAVATGLRKAHLVDKVHFQRHALGELAHTLVRVADEGHLPELRSVVLAYEPVTQSTFICNCRLIRESAQETIAIGSQCSNADSEEVTQWRDGKGAWLVAVGDRRPELLRVCAVGLCPARSTLVSFAKGLPDGPLPLSEDTLPIVDIPARSFVPKSEVPRVMVCIAGWCCAYPVVYVLPARPNGTDDVDSDMHANALAGEALWIIKARLFGLKSHDDHVLMQCSMPESIFSLSDYSDLDGVRAGTISVNDVSNLMQTQLEARLEEANQTSRMIWDQVEVIVEGPVVLDRVAL